MNPPAPRAKQAKSYIASGHAAVLRGRFIILVEAMGLCRDYRKRGAVAEAYCRATFPSG